MPPPEARELIDSSGCWIAPAVVYPASIVGSHWPVPTWNLPTERQSFQAASRLLPTSLPEELSASIRVGANPLAMMGDQSQSKRGKGWRTQFCLASGGNGEGRPA